MEKYAWMAKLKPGKKEEYIYRHERIWPEMVVVLKDAGISNYSISVMQGVAWHWCCREFHGASMV